MAQDTNAELREWELMPPIQWARLWFATGVLMMAHLAGWLVGWFEMGGPTWWLALVALITMSSLQTVEYLRRWSA